MLISVQFFHVKSRENHSSISIHTSDILNAVLSFSEVCQVSRYGPQSLTCSWSLWSSPLNIMTTDHLSQSDRPFGKSPAASVGR